MKLSVIVAWILSISFLQGCQLTRSHIGAGLGATTTTVACIQLGADYPYVIATCSLAGALAVGGYVGGKLSGPSKNTKADTVATACSFCAIMMEDAKNVTGNENKMKTMDIAELVADSID